MCTIDGATIIRTGYSRGSGHDKIFLRKVDGKVVVLQVETTSDGDVCIGISNVIDTLKKRVERYKEKIKECEEQVKDIEKW